MVSVSGQLQLHYVPFEELVDPEHAGDGRPLHRAGQRLPPADAVLGNVRQRRRADAAAIGSRTRLSRVQRASRRCTGLSR